MWSIIQLLCLCCAVCAEPIIQASTVPVLSLPQLWSTFASILEAPREELACMGLTFSVAVDQLGQAVEVPLGGAPQGCRRDAAGQPLRRAPLQ